MRTLLVDDDHNCVVTLNHFLKTYSFIQVVGEVNNAPEAIQFLQENRVDLVFLDIEMEGINGLQLASHLQLLYPDILIIFVTGHPIFALDSYDVHPVDFLTKPINVLRLEKALKRVREMTQAPLVEKSRKIGMKIGSGIRMIDVDDILYIEKQGRKISVVCKDNESFYSGDSMKNLEGIFSSFGFFRSHQSFLVPLHQIKAAYPDTLTRSYIIKLQDNKTELPLSRNKYGELIELLQKQTKKVIW